MHRISYYSFPSRGNSTDAISLPIRAAQTPINGLKKKAWGLIFCVPVPETL